jgi:hypothetical protein
MRSRSRHEETGMVGLDFIFHASLVVCLYGSCKMGTLMPTHEERENLARIMWNEYDLHYGMETFWDSDGPNTDPGIPNRQAFLAIAEKVLSAGYQHVGPNQIVVDRAEYQSLVTLHYAHFPSSAAMDIVHEPSMPVAGESVSNKTHIEIVDSAGGKAT